MKCEAGLASMFREYRPNINSKLSNGARWIRLFVADSGAAGRSVYLPRPLPPLLELRFSATDPSGFRLEIIQFCAVWWKRAPNVSTTPEPVLTMTSRTKAKPLPVAAGGWLPQQQQGRKRSEKSGGISFFNGSRGPVQEPLFPLSRTPPNQRQAEKQRR